MNSAQTHLDKMESELAQSKFRVRRDVELPDGSMAALTASKLIFAWKGLVLLSQHLVVKTADEPTVEEMQQLFEAGFQFAKKNNRVPLLRGMQFGYMIIPCILTSQEQISLPAAPPLAAAHEPQNSSLMRYVCGHPRSHFSIIELPVLYCLSSQKAHYFRDKGTWGAWMYPILQEIVGKYVDV